MVNAGSRWSLLGMTLALGCWRPDRGDPGPPQISVFVNSTRVEVIAQQPGSCRVLSDVQEPDECASAEWKLPPPTPTPQIHDLSELKPDCIPDPTCVQELSLERAGNLIGSVSGRSAVFSTVLTGDEAVVVSGCGKPLTIPLPAPLSGVDLQVNADAQGIHVAAEGAGVESTLGRAGWSTFADGFASACRSSSGRVTLPVSPDFDTYVVESFALGEPVVLEGGSVRVYPAARRRELISQTLPLGLLWQATVAAAKLSPHFEACDSYCSAWQQACVPTANRDQCNVLCVAEPTARPSCADAFERALRCSRDHLVCEATPPVPEAAPLPCDAEKAEYAACSDQTEAPAPADAD